MPNRDHYAVLSVRRNASDIEIKDAYRVLAKRFHPDVCTASDAEVKFKEIQDAYMVLSDPNKRSEYDLQLMVRETTGGSSDSYDLALMRFGVDGTPAKKTKKKKKGQKKVKHPKANVFLDELPDGTVPDDTLGGIL